MKSTAETEEAGALTSGKVGGKKTGAWLLRYALEQLPVTHTFGIPGVQNTEIYDELNKSEKIEPVLVTHEGGASFMADAMSRTSGNIGTLVIVPAAGVTHSMSGIGEAFLDGIPMLVISGGIRRDTTKCYQLHEWDQHSFLASVTKKTFLIRRHDQIVSTIYEAYHIATSGEPGPVFVEIPVDLQLFRGDAAVLPVFAPAAETHDIDQHALHSALELLEAAVNPAMFLGWGAREATALTVELAEKLVMPVSTTLQGLSVFPGDHPLHVGMGFGRSAVPAAANAFKNCDCLLTVGARFGEIPTGSFGVTVPEDHIHIDINPEVFDKNYPAKVKIAGDAVLALTGLLELVRKSDRLPTRDAKGMQARIRADKDTYLSEWKRHKTEDRVNPALFFESLRKQLDENAIMVVDDGNHTFLAAELFEVRESKHFISPTDFNCMGYCVPAAIGAKLANPDKQVVGVVGDGAFIMTCMEMLTATTHALGIVYFIFHDGELGQISQGQEIPYNRKICTVLAGLNLDGVARATGAAYLEINIDAEVDECIREAFDIAGQGRPVMVDIKIDYSKRTRFTQGLVTTVLKRFPLGDKFRFVGRAMLRKITG